jgi:hypothetical protein
MVEGGCMKHTKEPWDFLGERAPQIIGEDKVISLMYSENMLSGKDKRLLENAKRIVACVNACAGITNEALEAGYIKHLVEWNEVNHNCIDIVDSVKTPFEFKGVPIKEDV